MRELNIQLAFEAWASSQGLLAERAPGGRSYRCDIVQAQWVAWQASATLTPLAQDRYWIQRPLMERVRATLRFYGNPKNYEAPHGEGLLRRWLRPKPSAQQLALHASDVLRDLEHPRGAK